YVVRMWLGLPDRPNQAACRTIGMNRFDAAGKVTLSRLDNESTCWLRERQRRPDTRWLHTTLSCYSRDKSHLGMNCRQDSNLRPTLRFFAGAARRCSVH